MGWVDAGAIAAQVVGLESWWERPDVKLVGCSVAVDAASLMAYYGISIVIKLPQPSPAAAWFELDSGGES